MKTLLPVAVASALALSLALSSPSEAAQELGLNVHQSIDVGLDATHDAGLTWVRIDFNWFTAQPTNGPPDFTLFDTIVDQASARGLRVLATVGYTPGWASASDAQADGNSNDVPVDGAYAAFVTEVVAHFQDRVTHYELWNEPNLGVFFEGTPNDYIDRVLVPGADAVHAACSACMVVGPGLATVGDQYDVWLDAALGAANDKIDIVSGHIYSSFTDLGAGGTSGDTFFNKLESHRVILFDDIVAYEGPLSFKEVMDAHGSTQPFWITESGVEAALGDDPALARQATFYRHVLEAMLSRPWWTTSIFYEGFDEPAGQYHFGVTVHDGTPPHGFTAKPAFDLLKRARASQPRFGGNLTDCDDGLDEDGDGLIDFPADPDCASATDQEEGILSGGTGGAGGAGSTSSSGGAGGAGSSKADGGCGCEVPGSDSQSSQVALLGAWLLGVAAVTRSRGRRLRARARAADESPSRGPQSR